VIPGTLRTVPDGLQGTAEADATVSLLRFTTAGSVDDGKSTLIGRLLHDSKAVYEDQLASVRSSRINRSTGPLDFSLLTDGLRAEREQGITIDVAYRYFATPKRKFIIADTPGHEQYTRNMATGASTADLAVILVDATKGIVSQTRRHAFIASLLGIRQVVAAVNKMDLAGYREEIFQDVAGEFRRLAGKLGMTGVACIPISALGGDNVVRRSERMPWYEGPSLLEHLETVPLTSRDGRESLRFPVQLVIRPDADFRGYAGQVASGTVRPGDSVLALPSGRATRVRSIVSYDGDLSEAFAPMSVTLQLEDEIDVSRGDILVSREDAPRVSRRFRASVVWLHDTPLEAGRAYLVKHTTRQTRARALQIRHRVNIQTLEPEPAQRLSMNDIAVVDFEAHVPLFFDPYARNRSTGSFILIDALSNATVGAGMIQGNVPSSEQTEDASAEAAHATVRPEERYQRHGHYPAIALLGNRPQVASQLERLLFEQGFEVLHLNGNEISPPIFPQMAQAALKTGAILIYSGDALDAAAREQLAAISERRFLDLSADNAGLDEQELIRRATALAESLRLGGYTAVHKKAEQ
jgi:sulfate adenylyltransferase subunit 1